MPARPSVTLDAALRAVASEIHARRDEVIEAMLVRLADEMAEFDIVAEPELAAPVRRSCIANMAEALAVVTGDRALPSALPSETLAETRAALAMGITLIALEQNYRICHAVLWERFMVVAEGSGYPPEVAMGVLRHGWRCLFSYSDRVVRLVSDEYERERERALHSAEDRRAAYVREILRGGRVDAAQLGYELEVRHLAAIVSGPDAPAALKELSRRLGCPLLAVAVGDEGHRWAWFANPPDLEEVAGASRSVAASLHVRVAFGAPLEGPDGFRESKRQADLAERVAQHTAAPVTFHSDVALEAFALSDEPAARRFVARELRALDADGGRMANLRETLQTYLESAQNAASTAAALGIHDRTVSYRLRSAADLLGAPVAARATELGLALRIRRVLDPR